MIERGIGQLRTKLPPGIYQLKLRVGSRFEERYIRLRAKDRPKPFTFEHLEFPSPVPLAEPANAHDGQIDAAFRVSRTPPSLIDQGSGSSIFIFARDNSLRKEKGRRTPALAHPYRRLLLLDADGAEVAKLAERSESNLDEARRSSESALWAACHLQVEPGPYLLRLQTSAGHLEQTVIASKGWQTQVFLTLRDYLPGQREIVPDLPVRVNPTLTCA